MKRSEKYNLEYIKQVLRDWDPIGVHPGLTKDSAPQDEYDSYAPQILSRLLAGTSSDEILELLSKIRINDLGLSACSEKDRSVSDRLITWWAGRSRR